MSRSKKSRRSNSHPYIEEWIDLVRSKKVHSCKEQKQLVELVDKELARDDVELRHELVGEAVALIEKYFFPLMPIQKFVVALNIGLFYKGTDFLVFPDIFMLGGRGFGKNGLASALSFYFLSDKHGIKYYHVDIVATSEDQAKTSFEDVYIVIDDDVRIQPLYDYNLTHITYKDTRSRLRYRTANPKTKDGGRPGALIFDEIHAYENYDSIKVFTGGLGKVARPRRIYLTTDGEIRDGLLDEFKERARQILEGERDHDGFLPVILKLDDIKEVENPELWEKANPRIRYDQVLKKQITDEYKEMLWNESMKEAFFTKRMNLPYTSKMKSVCTWEDLKAATSHQWPDLTAHECIGAVDFADLRDFCSVGLRFKKDGMTYYLEHTFVHEESIRLAKYNVNLQEAIDDGFITKVLTKDHPTIPPALVVEWFTEMAKTYDIKRVHVDLFRSSALKEAFDNVGLEMKTVRSGSISHNKYAPEVLQMFSDRTVAFEDSKLIRWYIWNVEVVTDKKGNKTFEKIEPIRRKTDGFFSFLHSLIDADDLEEEVDPVIYRVRTY